VQPALRGPFIFTIRCLAWGMSPTEVELIKQIFTEVIPAHKFLNLELRDVRKGYALAYVPFREEMVGDPRHNRWHGGIIATLLDACGGAAAVTTFTSAEDQCSSIDIRVDFLEAGKPMDLMAEAEIVRDGNSVMFAKMRAWHEETGEVVAEGRAAYRITRVEAPTEKLKDVTSESIAADLE